MNIDEVSRKLRQRPPFLMIERVTELVEGERAVGIKNVSINEPYFAGHFPDSPIMPGVLVIECCAQLCSIAVTKGDAADDPRLYVLLKVDNFKFVRPIIPGDTLTVSVVKTRDAGPLVSFDATVKVGNTLCAKGSLTFTATDRENIYADKE